MKTKDRNTFKKHTISNRFLTKQYLPAILLVSLIVFAITFVVFLPSLQSDFVNWDDGSYIYENSNIQYLDSESLYWMLTSFHASNWHPLTWLSHAIDYRFFALNPWGHHLTSIVLHALNALLVFILVIKLMGEKKNVTENMELSSLRQPLIAATVTALLFGMHPLRVESVAWVTERKDLLCAFFYLLSILLYLTYTSSEVKVPRLLWFCAALFSFLFSLMSKPMAVTFPLILLLLDIYPLKRLKPAFPDISIVFEKIPFITLSVFSSIITVFAQQSGGALRTLERFPLTSRLLMAVKGLVFYLEKTIFPINLAPFYPLPKIVGLAEAPYIASTIVVLAITGLCIWLAKQGKILFIIIWSFYVITLLPVIGIIQVGHQSAADRYTYLPLLSIYLLAGVGVAWFFDRFAWKRPRLLFGALALLLTLIIFSLGLLTRNQIKVWRDSVSLWTHELNIYPESVSFPYCSLGNAYLDQSLVDEAIDEYKRALEIEPGNSMASSNLGVAYEKKDMLDEAIAQYKHTIKVDPNYDLPHCNLGNVYNAKEMYEESILAYKKALSINPNNPIAYNNLGKVYAKIGRKDDAITVYKKALDLNPRYLEAQSNLAAVYMYKGSADDAITDYQKALTLNPNDAKVHCNLAAAYNKKRMFDEAISECNKAIALDPRYAKAYFNLGSAYGNKGMMGEAIANFEQAITINPQYAKAYHSLALAYYYEGNYKLSIEYFDRAKELGANVNPKIVEQLQPYR